MGWDIAKSDKKMLPFILPSIARIFFFSQMQGTDFLLEENK